jgi:zinc transporter
MLVLAAVTTVFMPLTLITGLLGMNVSGIPMSDNPLAFAIVCFTMLAMAGGTVWFMHSKRWL